MNKVVSFGEVMIELSRSHRGGGRIGFGGDTLNTAVYLSRLGVPTAYMTALGGDPWSDDLREAMRLEDVSTELTLSNPHRAPGVYAISVADNGERSFLYWRDRSAARGFFECPEVANALSLVQSAPLFYFSGVTLALFSKSERARIVDLARQVRSKGGLVAFDPNFRAKLWPTTEAYQQAVQEVAAVISIALPSFEDEARVWGDRSADDALARWRALGVADVVIKDGPRGALTERGWAAAPEVKNLVDTTGAGDSFNAAYLAARLRNRGVLDAALEGVQLAAAVIAHPGAIIPRDAMPSQIGERL